jgi:hypothetical protein
MYVLSIIFWIQIIASYPTPIIMNYVNQGHGQIVNNMSIMEWTSKKEIQDTFETQRVDRLLRTYKSFE